jgi:hypothetical protein
MVVSSLLRKACEYEWNLSLYVEIMACQKSQMHENFSFNFEWKSCIQIMDENHSTRMKPIS